jgi:hypothetical protein
MDDEMISEDQSGAEAMLVEPPSKADRAFANQRKYATEYSQLHWKKQIISGFLAVVMACYVGYVLFKLDTSDRGFSHLSIAFSAAAASLGFSIASALARTKCLRIPPATIGAWFFLGLEESLAFYDFHSYGNIMGAAYVISVLGIVLLPSYGLFIPADPSVDWVEVLLEQTMLVHTATGGESYRKLINNYREAENIAASWLRRFGYPDAHVTADRQDDGIDVESIGAVAQVKYWKTKRVGIAEVQRLAGSARRGQACYFFAALGYTKAATRWAESPDNRMKLFVMRSDGNIFAWNHRARRALRETKPQIPSEQRSPIPFWLVVGAGAFLGCDSAFFAWVTVILYLKGAALTLVIVFAIFTLSFSLGFIGITSEPINRLRKSIKNGQGLSLREIVTLPVNDVDAGLPADVYAGYAPDFTRRVFGLIEDMSLERRAMGRIIRARTRS